MKQLKQQVITLNEMTFGHIITVITELPHDNTIQVVLRAAKEKRRLAQNALYWAWLTALEEQTGNTRNDLHEIYKSDHLIPIYVREALTPEQINWVDLYLEIRSTGDAALISRCKRVLSSGWATVRQFAEYLKVIEHECIENGLKLPMDPRYKEAMHV
jgi:hypothetical protein